MISHEEGLEFLLTFGDRLREHRYRLNITQEDVAIATGLTVKSVHNFESGSIYPSVRTMARLVEWMIRSRDDGRRPGSPREERRLSGIKGWETRQRNREMAR